MHELEVSSPEQEMGAESRDECSFGRSVRSHSCLIPVKLSAVLWRVWQDSIITCDFWCSGATPSRKVCCGCKRRCLITFCPWGLVWREKSRKIFFRFDSVILWQRRIQWKMEQLRLRSFEVGEGGRARGGIIGCIWDCTWRFTFVSGIWSRNLTMGCGFGSEWECYWLCLENSFGQERERVSGCPIVWVFSTLSC